MRDGWYIVCFIFSFGENGGARIKTSYPPIRKSKEEQLLASSGGINSIVQIRDPEGNDNGDRGPLECSQKEDLQ